MWKSLGENISYIIMCRHICHANLPCRESLPDIAIMNLNMLGASMKGQIMGYNRLSVNMGVADSCLIPKSTNNCLMPNMLNCGCENYPALSLTIGGGDWWLLFTEPWNTCITKLKGKFSSEHPVCQNILPNLNHWMHATMDFPHWDKTIQGR